MNIAIILPSLANTGPGIVANDLCKEYIKSGHFCKIFYFDDIHGLDVSCPVERISFKQQIDFDNWDIIHSHMFRPDAYIWYHKSKIKKAKTITTLHNPVTYKATRTGFGILTSVILPIVWNQFIRSHNWVVTLNTDTFNQLPKTIKKKSSVIFNGRNINSQINSLSSDIRDRLMKIHNEWKVVGTISSLTKRKGLDQAIRALLYIPDYFLIIVGEGPEREGLEKLAKDLKVNDRIFFAGFQKKPEEILAYVDLFIMCSESEGFPLALIEAAACSTPAILSDIPILQSIISDNEGVKFYKLHDIKDLADKINKGYEEKEVMRHRIYNYYHNNLTADIMAKNYINQYQCLLNT